MPFLPRWLSLVLLILLAAPASRAAEPPAAPAGRSEFTLDVAPALTKAGCNVGACHGSFQGRGGLKLSLLGFDPLADYDKLVKEARGRRVFPAAPDQSLLLLKPTLGVPHGGGRRLEVGSETHRILRTWIENGLSAPGADDPAVTRLRVEPPESLLASGQTMELKVEALYGDGSARDVTPWALYETREPRVAEVDGAGRVQSTGPGRTSITVRYMGQVAAVPVTTPFSATVSTSIEPATNFIDDQIASEWKKLGLQPAPLADDAEFARRVYLDLIGTLPAPAEVREFLGSAQPDKRQRLIDQLLERGEYVDYWALKWSDLLRAHRRSLGEKGLNSFATWLRQRLRENAPFDQVVRELLTAQGNLYTQGPVAFYFVDKTPEELAETTSQVFLGIRLQCAHCHHHPFEVWSQDDYYGLAAFFARLQRKDTKEGGAFGGAQSLGAVAQGQVMHPVTQRPAELRAFGWTPPVAAPGEDSRLALAAWLTAPENPFFARSVVNRYWSYMLGRGLVEPLDDMRATNPATHPELLAALERDFVEHKFDLKHLVRTICNSRTYQLASEISPERDADGMFYTHRRPRRLPAEVLLDAINQAIGSQETFEGLPLGVRAIALPDSNVASYFLDAFGRPRRTSACECERGSRPDLGQALHLANSETLQVKLAATTGRLATLLAGSQPDADLIEELYLAALSRRPFDDERAAAQRFIQAAPSRREGFEDLLWTLLNCGEFAFNH